MQLSKILAVVCAAKAVVGVPTETKTELEKEGVLMFWDGVNAPIPANTTNAVLKTSKPATTVQTRTNYGEAISATIKAIGKGAQWAYAAFTWDDTRQRFTQETVKEMMEYNPDYRTWPAAVCYNLGYHVRDWNRISSPQSKKLTSGPFYTTYDCMFIMTNNAFWTDSDGGYENLAYYYDESRCSYDGNTGDLTCK